MDSFRRRGDEISATYTTKMEDGFDSDGSNICLRYVERMFMDWLAIKYE